MPKGFRKRNTGGMRSVRKTGGFGQPKRARRKYSTPRPAAGTRGRVRRRFGR